MVSYILCVYNGEKTLSFCIESLLSQQNADIELVIVNDGSIDSSGKIIESYSQKDRRIKVFTQDNVGLPLSRNFGISQAAGEYIASAAQDDVYLPTKTSEQISFMEKKHLDFSFTNIQTIDENGKFISFRSMVDYNKQLLPWPLSFIQVALYQPVCSPSFICKRECYEKVKWNPGFIAASDLNLILKMFLNYRGGKLNKNLLLRRIRLSEHTSTFRPFYTKKFLSFERNLAIYSTIFIKFPVAQFLLNWVNYLQIIKNILLLEINPAGKDIYVDLSHQYSHLGFKEAAKRMDYLSQNVPLNLSR